MCSAPPARCGCRTALMPPLMNNHGNFIVSLGDVCRYLAQQGRSARRRNLSGLCRHRSAVRERRGRRHRHRRHGRRQGRPSQAELHPRHGAARQIHAVRRRRARQPDQSADRALRPWRKTASRRNSASASRNCGRSPRTNSAAASSSTPWAGRSTTHRRRLVPLSLRRQSGRGRLCRASQLPQSVSVAVRGIPALQDPSAGARHLRRRQAAFATARAPSPRAAGSRCRSSRFPAAR